jgi:hypothetical protein
MSKVPRPQIVFRKISDVQTQSHPVVGLGSEGAATWLLWASRLRDILKQTEENKFAVFIASAPLPNLRSLITFFGPHASLKIRVVVAHGGIEALIRATRTLVGQSSRICAVVVDSPFWDIPQERSMRFTAQSDINDLRRVFRQLGENGVHVFVALPIVHPRGPPQTDDFVEPNKVNTAKFFWLSHLTISRLAGGALMRWLVDRVEYKP